MAEWLAPLSIALIVFALSRMVRLDVAKTLQFINEGLQKRAVRKRQRNCDHSWVIEWGHPYSWCVRCQKHVPTESLDYLAKAGLLR